MINMFGLNSKGPPDVCGPLCCNNVCFIAVLGLLSVLGVKRGSLTIVPLTPLRRVGQCTGAVQVQTCVATSHCTSTQGHNDMTSATAVFVPLYFKSILLRITLNKDC